MQAHPNASRFVQKETRDPTEDKKANTPNYPQMIWCIAAKNKVFGAAPHRSFGVVLYNLSQRNRQEKCTEADVGLVKGTTACTAGDVDEENIFIQGYKENRSDRTSSRFYCFGDLSQSQNMLLKGCLQL